MSVTSEVVLNVMSLILNIAANASGESAGRLVLYITKLLAGSLIIQLMVAEVGLVTAVGRLNIGALMSAPGIGVPTGGRLGPPPEPRCSSILARVAGPTRQ